MFMSSAMTLKVMFLGTHRYVALHGKCGQRVATCTDPNICVDVHNIG